MNQEEEQLYAEKLHPHQPSPGSMNIPDLEIEAALDPVLVKKVMVTVKMGAIEIKSRDGSKTVYSMLEFMGAEVDTDAKSGKKRLTIFHSRIKKGVVTIVEDNFYSDKPEMLLSFRDRAIALFYLKIEGDAFEKAQSPRKRFLFFISPASGKGKALKFYEDYKRHFEGLDIHCTKIVTERRNHAQDYIFEMKPEELSKIDAVVCVSGDGIPHEVINGFLKRPDHQQLKLNMGVLPGGSGCALLYNCLKVRGLEFSPESATYMITRFLLKRKSVFKFTMYPSNTEVYGLLNHLMGFFADVDFASEKLRCLGNLRFEVCGACKGICPGSQNAEISWKRSIQAKSGEAPPQSGDLKAPLLSTLDKSTTELKTANSDPRHLEMDHSMTEPVYFLNLHTLPYMSIGIKVAPELGVDSDQAGITIMPKKSGWCKFISYLLNFGDGEFTKNPKAHGVIHEDVQRLRIKLLPDNAKKGDKKVIVGVDGERYEASEIFCELVENNTISFLC